MAAALAGATAHILFLTRHRDEASEGDEQVDKTAMVRARHELEVRDTASVGAGLPRALSSCMRLGVLAILCAACGGGQTNAPDRRGVAERVEAARQHEQKAAEHERLAEATEGNWVTDDFNCLDPVLNDQLTTGGLRVTQWTPCIDVEFEAELRHRRAAIEERRLARSERAAAARLSERERVACQGIPPIDLYESPFARRDAIERIDAVIDGPRVVGVRVSFDRDAGIEPEALRREIACQRARWAVAGRDPRWIPQDPTLVDDARVTVSARGDVIDVLVISRSEASATVALARARGELLQQAAER